MFKAARWRSEKKRIKAVFRFQFKATQVPGEGWEAMTVTLVPADVGKPCQRSEKAAILHRACLWPRPIYEAVRLSQDQRTGKISDKVYMFIVSATGRAKSGVLGEIGINLAEYAEAFKPTSVPVPVQGSNDGAILHVTIQRMHGDVKGRQTVEDGEIPRETIENNMGTTVREQRRTLKSQLGNQEYQAEEGSFVNGKALVKFHSSRIIHPHEDSSDNLRKSSSFDAISASGSESSSGQYTPKENGIKNNASLLSPRNIDCSMSSALDVSVAGSANNSGETGLRDRTLGSENSTIEKQKIDLDTLARRLEMSELELQTLRKQVVKESRRGQDLSKELNSLKEERDALRKECEELKASKKGEFGEENTSAMLQFGAKDQRSMLKEMKEELDQEKPVNANLRLQLQKTQESNSELIFAVKDVEELLEHKNQVLHLRNFEVEQESFEPTSYHEEEPCELDILIEKRDDIRVSYSNEQKNLDLNGELELYKRDRDDLEMQMEQLALDYEILKQENHDISSRLEHIQLREQLRMQYECSAHLAIISDLETNMEIVEKEIEKQADAHEANLATIIQAKVAHEQRAIQAEEELIKSRRKNAKTVEQLQDEFKRLASQLSNTFYVNEDMIMKTLEESRELRMEKCQMGELLEKKNYELSSLQHQHQVKCQQLLSLIDFKTKEVDRVLRELEAKKEELDNRMKSEEAMPQAWGEEISILKAEIEQLTRENICLSAEVEQKENLVTEIERLKTSTKDMEMLLQERNMENEVLGKELHTLKEEAKKSFEELNTLRYLKAEQETVVKTLNSKLQTLAIQYPDMKQCLTDATLEKENLWKHTFLLRGDLSKEADIISSVEQKLKNNNAKLMVSEGNKSKESLQASHGYQIVDMLHKNSTTFDDEIGTNKNFEDGDMNVLKSKGVHLQEKMVEDLEFMNFVHQSYGEGIRSDLIATTKTEVEGLASCTYDQQKIAQVLSEMAELKERNGSMEEELKEMQERYSEMSLKFAEVEGEREQLVIRIRSLKNALKN